VLFDNSLPELEEDLDFPPDPPRIIYGLESVFLNEVPRHPYPINIYNLDGDDTSGIAGTLHPDGTFAPLKVMPAPQPTRWWEDSVATFIYGVNSWNSCVAGGIELGAKGEPHKRLYDGSLVGEWPNHPPRPGRLVNPEKARLAAEIRAAEEREGG
jgi:hypothetical protein